MRLASIALVLLAACGQENTGSDGQPNTVAAEVPTPASNAATPAAPTPPAEPVLTAEGYGPLRIGMTLAEVTAALGADAEPDAVGGPEPERCDQFRPARAPEGLLVMIEDGRLTRISLHREARVATDRDLRLGATPAQVRAAYGAALQAEPHKYQDPPAEYLTHWAQGGPRPPHGVAEPNSRGISYSVGQDGRVEAIHAGGPSIQYVEGCL
jgi:hypothetical protein